MCMLQELDDAQRALVASKAEVERSLKDYESLREQLVVVAKEEATKSKVQYHSSFALSRTCGLTLSLLSYYVYRL